MAELESFKSFTHRVRDLVQFEKGKKVITALSIGCSVIDVLFLAMMKEPYAIIVAFLLLLIKSGLLYKQAKAG